MLRDIIKEIEFRFNTKKPAIKAGFYVQGWTVRILLQANPKYIHPCRQCSKEPRMAVLPNFTSKINR